MRLHEDIQPYVTKCRSETPIKARLERFFSFASTCLKENGLGTSSPSELGISFRVKRADFWLWNNPLLIFTSGEDAVCLVVANFMMSWWGLSPLFADLSDIAGNLDRSRISRTPNTVCSRRVLVDWPGVLDWPSSLLWHTIVCSGFTLLRSGQVGLNLSLKRKT